jgi:hypothetical protein
VRASHGAITVRAIPRSTSSTTDILVRMNAGQQVKVFSTVSLIMNVQESCALVLSHFFNYDSIQILVLSEQYMLVQRMIFPTTVANVGCRSPSSFPTRSASRCRKAHFHAKDAEKYNILQSNNRSYEALCRSYFRFPHHRRCCK